MKYNFHTHSGYDDGREGMQEYVETAIEKGFVAIGLSGHQPLPFDNEWSLPKKDYPDYLAEAKRLREQYRDQIDVYIGLEMDYIPGFSEDFRGFRKEAGLDYVIGSVHLVMKPGSDNTADIWFIDGPREGYIEGIQRIFGGDIKAAVEAYYSQQREMVSTQKPDIIGHLDKVNMHNKRELFDTSSSWYQKAVDDLLDAVKEHDTIVELNTRGVYTGKTEEYFPSKEILQKCIDRDIRLMVNTDAHHPSQLDKHFDRAVMQLKNMGLERIHTPFFESAL